MLRWLVTRSDRKNFRVSMPSVCRRLLNKIRFFQSVLTLFQGMLPFPLLGCRYMFISLAYVDCGDDSHALALGLYPSKSTALIRIAALTMCFPF